MNWDDRLREAAAEPGLARPVEPGRERWRELLARIFRDGNGDDVAEEATVVMVWEEGEREKKMEEEEGEGREGRRNSSGVSVVQTGARLAMDGGDGRGACRDGRK